MAKREDKYQELLEKRRMQREAEEAKRRAVAKKNMINIAICVVGVIVIVAAAVLLILRPWQDKTTLTSGNGDSSVVSDASDAWADWKPKHDMTKKHNVAIEVKDYGTIKVELDPTYAPITVDNFLTLVENKFYDGLTFHRIIDGFMIQGGDPNGNGTGGSSNNIKGEFSSNGVNNPLKHTRGVISMARATHPDSASSQFFIMHEDASHLDGSYAAFGKVTDGMDVVDAIVDAAKPTDGNGSISRADQPIITKISIID